MSNKSKNRSSRKSGLSCSFCIQPTTATGLSALLTPLDIMSPSFDVPSYSPTPVQLQQRTLTSKSSTPSGEM